MKKVILITSITAIFLFILSSYIYKYKLSNHVQLKNNIFKQSIIDNNGPRESWGKAIGDINGDGLVDIVIGGQKKPKPSLLDKVLIKSGFKVDNIKNSELVWYENPGWDKHIVSTEYSIRTDIAVADINNDGKNDIVITTNIGLIWLKNPGWEPVLINNKKFHDVEVYDLDGDGSKEIIARDQSLFGHKNGNKVYIFSMLANNNWSPIVINIPDGEGIEIADLNNDNLLDIVVNKIWLRNPGSLDINKWEKINYSEGWDWDDVKIKVADINGDKYNDIVLTPAESVGGIYQISWFESTVIDSEISWKLHTIDSNIESVFHSLATEDFDSDGDIDVLTAEMNQSKGNGQIILYRKYW